jgi:hypothetical protein
MLIDLQVHSDYSDGYLTPTEVAKFLRDQGVKTASLTDHNTVGGLDEFAGACNKYGIKPVTGLELYSTLKNKRLSILWYNFDHTNAELHKMLRDSQNRRRNQTRKILARMEAQGFRLDIDRLLDKYNHYISLNHLIDDIKAAPANYRKIRSELGLKHPREEDIIRHYFHRRRGSLSSVYKLDNSNIGFERITALRKKIGGQLIFNHPAKYGQLNLELITAMKKLGLDGIEVLSPHHSIGDVLYAQHLVQELDLISSGGSDFHRMELARVALKYSWQYFKIDSSHLKGVEKIIG